MSKTEFLNPTLCFEKFGDITADILRESGISGVLCDIDDTLVTHNFPLPTDEVTAWVKDLKQAGIKICFISNNRYKRVKPFATALACPFFTRAGKPSDKFLKKALAVLDIEKNEAVFVGDQIFTDIKGGNRFGISTYKVKPLGEKATLWIKFKRNRERKLAND